jgi:hypothetical protein
MALYAFGETCVCLWSIHTFPLLVLDNIASYIPSALSLNTFAQTSNRINLVKLVFLSLVHTHLPNCHCWSLSIASYIPDALSLNTFAQTSNRSPWLAIILLAGITLCFLVHLGFRRIQVILKKQFLVGAAACWWNIGNTEALLLGFGDCLGRDVRLIRATFDPSYASRTI